MAEKVMVAMSGGVDSSVALLRVMEMGYDPIGVTMKLWKYDDVGGNLVNDTNCCSVDTVKGAKLVCDRLGVPHYTIDFTGVFKDRVVDNFADEYLRGRTPNPCVRCNSFVKWEAFFEQAAIVGASRIATGHYARIEYENGNPLLKKGLDPLKDQAYVLWGIPRDTLDRTILPLGNLTKPEVREIARQNGFATAETPESMEICFIADDNYKRFLKDYRPVEVAKISKGKIREGDKVVGEHPGFINYTIGQRKGLGLSTPEPRYVQRIDPSTNTITVARKADLTVSKCRVSQINWLVDEPTFPLQAVAQIRYNSRPASACIRRMDGSLQVDFDEPILSVTPGQSIVFYNKDIVLGGGIIEHA